MNCHSPVITPTESSSIQQLRQITEKYPDDYRAFVKVGDLKKLFEAVTYLGYAIDAAKAGDMDGDVSACLLHRCVMNLYEELK